MFLLTVKRDGEKRQHTTDEYKALNLVRRFMLTFGKIEETSADLQSIKLIEQAKKGQPKAVEINGRVLVVQKA